MVETLATISARNPRRIQGEKVEATSVKSSTSRQQMSVITALNAKAHPFQEATMRLIPDAKKLPPARNTKKSRSLLTRNAAVIVMSPSTTRTLGSHSLMSGQSIELSSNRSISTSLGSLQVVCQPGADEAEKGCCHQSSRLVVVHPLAWNCEEQIYYGQHTQHQCIDQYERVKPAHAHLPRGGE